jgi:hypothetical protein
MLYSTRKEITTHGTPVTVNASGNEPEMSAWGTISADINNHGIIYVGGVDPDTKSCAVKNSVDNGGDYVGHRLQPGDWVTFREVLGVAYMDVNDLFADADSSGDSVLITYWRGLP